MAIWPELVVSIVGIIMTGVLGLVGYVARTLRSDVDEALENAETANQRVDSLEQMLVGSDAEADSGLLIELKADVKDLKDKTDQNNRLQAEKNYNVSNLVRILAESEDGIKIDTEDGRFRLYGDRLPDGGVPIPQFETGQ